VKGLLPRFEWRSRWSL